MTSPALCSVPGHMQSMLHAGRLRSHAAQCHAPLGRTFAAALQARLQRLLCLWGWCLRLGRRLRHRLSLLLLALAASFTCILHLAWR